MENARLATDHGSSFNAPTLVLALAFFLICLSAALVADYGILPSAGTDVIDTSITEPLPAHHSSPHIWKLPASGADVAP